MHTDEETGRIGAMEHIRTAMQKSGAGSSWSYEASGQTAWPSREATWAMLPLMAIAPGKLEANRIVAAGPSSPSRSAFDMMRTKVLHELKQNNWTSVAITSPTPGGGKSAVALNLAFSLANREDCRAVLIDLDLRCPRIAQALGVRNPPAIEKYLRSHIGMEDVFQRVRPNLAIACNGRPVNLPAELLQSPETAKVFRDLKRKLTPDVIICDLPPMLTNDDVMAFLPNVDCVVLVVEAEANTLEQVDACEHELSLQTNLLGVVVNKCRYDGETSAYQDGG